MEKVYILDTNVLIQAPYAVECFEDNEVVLPMTVLEELDNLKKEEGEKGRDHRQSRTGQDAQGRTAGHRRDEAAG